MKSATRISTLLVLTTAALSATASLFLHVFQYDLFTTMTEAIAAGIPTDIDAKTHFTSTVMELRNSLQAQRTVGVFLSIVQIATLILVFAFSMRSVRSDYMNAHIKRAHDMQKDAREAAERAERSKTEFLANISHELRTPVHGIMAMLDLIGSQKLTDEQRGFLSSGEDCAKHLMGLLSDLLDASKLENGSLALAPRATALQSVLRDIDALTATRAEESGLRFTIAHDASVPQWLMVDAKRLRQILLNLVNNAIKFTNQGSVKLEISSIDEPTGKVKMIFRVVDTGIGIAPDVLPNIFKRFYQADTSISRSRDGAGLGLEISDKLARLMDGEIRAESVYGKGSTFTFEVSLESVMPVRNEPVIVRTSGLDQSAADQIHVLVAEDDHVSRKFIDTVLSNLGIAFTMCRNGAEAIEQAKHQRYDFILMDLHMPLTDGFEATTALRSVNNPNRSTPIIMMTADAMEDTKDKATALGVTEWVTKPMRQATLTDVVKRHAAIANNARAKTSVLH